MEDSIFDYIFDNFDEEYLAHVGVGHDKGGHSGRYPWGSGDNPYQHEGGLRGYVKACKAAGCSEADIARAMHVTVNELRKRQSVEKILERNTNVMKVRELYDAGITNKSEIGRRLNMNEGSVRSYLDSAKHDRNNQAIATRDMLKSEIDKHGPTDIGSGVEVRLGISRTKLNTAVFMLESEGYKRHTIKVKQMNTEKMTNMEVLAPPSNDSAKQWSDLVRKPEQIHEINDTYTDDGGRTWGHIEKPVSVDSKRIYVRYAEDGGKDKDGLIEIRPNVKDLDMGGNAYSQVRIGVDNTHYMKGVAIYSNHIPDGYDIVYNSKKDRGAPFEKVFKAMKTDNEGNIIWDNPFGAAIKMDEVDEEGNIVRRIGQRHYIDTDGKEKLSPINIVREEGDWAEWKKSLAAQMLSKQSVPLAKQQLNLAYDRSKREYDEITHLENPIVKQHLLASFASDCDSKSVHLKAAALPNQVSHVIIPVPEMKNDEVYAPNYKDGEIVSLVRFPHEGVFQIPTLRVNNRNKAAREALGSHPRDAIGINKHVADIMSGADFDGDTVLVIPNPGGKLIKSMAPLEGLKDFDTEQYEWPSGTIHKKVGLRTKNEADLPIEKQHDGFDTQMEMGKISNLITDMTLQGANPEELARAVRHSMVVIDAEKHNLNWKQSEKDNNIKELKKKYQGGGGVSTLISRAKHEVDVIKRKEFQPNMIDPETGKIEWQNINTEKVYKDVDGSWVHTGEPNKNAYKTKRDKETGEYYLTNELKTQKSTLMDEAFNRGEDAYSLSSGTPMENAYADYANRMKALGNEARKQMILTRAPKSSKEAAEQYAPEVSSLMAKLNEAIKDRPLERKANAIAGAELRVRKEDNPEMTKDDEMKIRTKALAEARRRLGITRHNIKITPREWEAIQANAISPTKLRQILTRTDMDVVRDYATPKNYTPKLSKSEINVARSMLNNYTAAQVAEHFGVSVTTLYDALG